MVTAAWASEPNEQREALQIRQEARRILIDKLGRRELGVQIDRVPIQIGRAKVVAQAVPALEPRRILLDPALWNAAKPKEKEAIVVAAYLPFLEPSPDQAESTVGNSGDEGTLFFRAIVGEISEALISHFRHYLYTYRVPIKKIGFMLPKLRIDSGIVEGCIAEEMPDDSPLTVCKVDREGNESRLIVLKPEVWGVARGMPLAKKRWWALYAMVRIVDGLNRAATWSSLTTDILRDLLEKGHLKPGLIEDRQAVAGIACQDVSEDELRREEALFMEASRKVFLSGNGHLDVSFVQRGNFGPLISKSEIKQTLAPVQVRMVPMPLVQVSRNADGQRVQQERLAINFGEGERTRLPLVLANYCHWRSLPEDLKLRVSVHETLPFLEGVDDRRFQQSNRVVDLYHSLSL